MSLADTAQDQLRKAIQMAARNGGRGSEAVQARHSSTPGPRHPVLDMQASFEESIEDASNPADTRQQEAFNNLAPKQRRQKLLDSSVNGTYNEQWRTHSVASKYHPLTKIISQIAFGIHLLHRQMAKSDEEVVKILQKHVDEVDNFLQRGEEDFALAVADIRERINYLKLPLEHTGVFDVMLDDKKFRTSILEGNEKIEKVVDRTANHVKDVQVDVQKAMESTLQMGAYLDDISEEWPTKDRGSIEIFKTMQANVEGWVQALSALQMKGNSLSVAVVQLGSILNEMAKRAGSASRREQRRADRARTGVSRSQSRQFDASTRVSMSKITKPLPEQPDLVAGVVVATMPDARLPLREKERSEKHYNIPRKAPERSNSRPTTAKSSTLSMPKKQKPPSLHLGKMSTSKRNETGKADTPKRMKLADLANVFRFQSSAAPSPMASPTLPPPAIAASLANSPYATPLVSPKLSRHAPHISVDAVEMEAHVPQELENEAQSALIEARSRLRQQSREALNAKHLQTPVLSDSDQPALSPLSPSGDANDSAYASSPEIETRRPRTSPINRKPVAGFGNWPSASVTSFHSVATTENPPSSRGNITALPPLPAPAALTQDTTPNDTTSQRAGPTLMRRTSIQALPSLRNSSSFQTLRKLFQRGGRSASLEPKSRRKQSEQDGVFPDAVIGGQNSDTDNVGARVDVVNVLSKKTPLEDVFELPG